MAFDTFGGFGDRFLLFLPSDDVIISLSIYLVFVLSTSSLKSMQWAVSGTHIETI